MKIVLAPDSFKSSLTAREAAGALAAGVRHSLPNAECLLLPLADGGEGTVDALITATLGRTETARVCGPLGEPIDAVWGQLGTDGRTSVIEMAAAAGLGLVPPNKRDPGRTTTYGVGELLLRAAASGANQIIVGLGGSATNDGGAGAMQALGVRFLDASGRSLPEPLCGLDLIRLARLDTTGLRFPLVSASITAASDVTNPLLGASGASAVYGPQKGADAAGVAALEAALTNYAVVLRRDLGKDMAALPGAGAAGGMGAGLIAFLDAEMKSGIDLLLDYAGFDTKAQGADWVFTGEGRIDAQTLSGKTISGLLHRCRTLGVPVIAFGGSVDADAVDQLLEAGLRAAFPIVSGPLSLEEAMRDAKTLLTQTAARVARLL